MNWKRGMTIGALFVLSGFTLYAQQAGAARCSVPFGPLQKAMQAVCKPAPPGTQRLLSNDLPPDDDGASYVSFDVPGAANGTFTAGINDWATVTGYYVDAEQNYHGFVRDWVGHITSFDVPGDGGGTAATAINDAGTVTGNWCTDLTFTVCPGFVRDLEGNITSFDAPGDAGGTYPFAINPESTIVGEYFDASGLIHGFLRTRDGAITEFDAVSGAVWTWPSSINPDGTTAGAYQDADHQWHGFMRSRNGSITTFDVPGGMRTGEGAFYGGPPTGINPQSAIAGAYFQPIPTDPGGGTYQGFLRTRDGSFDTFYAADYLPCCVWTFPTAVAADETIAGYLNDGYDINRGFVRTLDGNVTVFDAPGAGTGNLQGTVVVGMNESGVIAGFYIDNSGLSHGFLRIPH